MKKYSKKYYTENAFNNLNITPFIDLMLVLLVIFIISAQQMFSGIETKINLPKSFKLEIPTSDEITYVNITYTKEKKIYLNNNEISKDNLLDFLPKEITNDLMYNIVIAGDKDLKYGDIMDLMILLKEAGYVRVTLLTENKKITTEENIMEEKN